MSEINGASTLYMITLTLFVTVSRVLLTHSVLYNSKSAVNSITGSYRD